MKALFCVGVVLVAILTCFSLWYRDHRRWKKDRARVVERLGKIS